MTGSTNFVSLSTYAFAFAVALSPAVMQQSLSCNPATGDATLSALEVEVMGENHIRTARAYGLPERVVVFRYALKLAVLPTVTVIGVGMGFLLSAALFTEIVFARPGIGKLIFDSISTRNYPVVMGSVLVSTVLFVISTTLSDLVNAWLDPRIRASL